MTIRERLIEILASDNHCRSLDFQVKQLRERGDRDTQLAAARLFVMRAVCEHVSLVRQRELGVNETSLRNSMRLALVAVHTLLVIVYDGQHRTIEARSVGEWEPVDKPVVVLADNVLRSAAAFVADERQSRSFVVELMLGIVGIAS